MIVYTGQFEGLADSKVMGTANSFHECVGLDGRSEPGILKVQQKLTKDSGSTIDAFVKLAISASNGYSFWFSSTSGKIWARASNGTWTLAYTTVPAAGTAGCLGAAEYNGYIYWATQSRLHRIAIADADDSWASVSLDWATFDVTDASFHPMCIQQSATGPELFIGDGYQVAGVDANGTFRSNVLDINTPHRIKAMAPYELDVVIGTYVADNVNKSEIIRWDTVSTSWNVSDPIDETGINAFIRDDNYLYVSVGTRGRLYFYNGEKLEPYKNIPGDYSNTKSATIHPGSVAMLNGIPVFGVSNLAGNSTLQGVYGFGSYSRDYVKSLSLDFVISQAKTTSIEIGALLVMDGLLYVAWKDDTTYGVDKLDTTAKYTDAYFITRQLFQDNRDDLKTLGAIHALYESLPDNTGFTFWYSVNGADFVEIESDFKDTVLAAWKGELSVPEIGSLQIEVDFDVSSNDAPELNMLDVILA